MRIELVCPAAEDSAPLRSLAIAILAGLTPPDVALSFKDDIIGRLDPERDLDTSVDLAAITVSTKSALRAYELADAYRAHGVRVALGGIHPTALPEEALAHCDAVVVGEAEGLWEQLLADQRRGALQRIYRHATLPGYSRPTRPRRDLFRSRRYVPVHTVQATRGCPFSCEFCSVTPFFGRDVRRREVRGIVEEIEQLDRRWVMFADDNIVGHAQHSRELFQALSPLKLTWFGQASLQGLRDLQSIRLMAASGCRGLFIGFESVSAESLAGCGKTQNHPDQYREIVRALQGEGIAVWGSFVLGLDDDREEIFERTLQFAVDARIFMALFALLTPYPGTPLYRRLQAEGRLLEERWWLRPDRDDFPLFRPRHMSPERLHEGWQWTWKEFYSAGAILRRFSGASMGSLFALLSFFPLNLHQRRLTRDKILGGDKFFLRDH
jgi:radical SAM superfamily enzyme YgiQ (UPF0313 family)